MVEKLSWVQRLKSSLQKTSRSISDGLTAMVSHRKLDQEALDELEELLIRADFGVQTAQQFTAALSKQKFQQDISSDEVKTFLADQISAVLRPEPEASTLVETIKTQDPKPAVLLMVGVNGSGKTTTIGKLAAQWAGTGLKVRVAAGDTFRAAAIEQLSTWTTRAGVPLFSKPQGTDPASLAHDALAFSNAQHDDVLLIDTAGRLQNQQNLMQELSKMKRVLGKLDPTAPHHCLLVLDATVGQNALSQVKLFNEAIPLTGLIVTKLDGTAKGGIVVQIAQQFRLPIVALGVGEQLEDLQPFDAEAFARNLVGL